MDANNTDTTSTPSHPKEIAMTALAHALTTLLIHIPAADAIHPLTREAQASDPRVNTWLSGQLWAWEGGDCVTITTGCHYGAPDHRVYFVIREGDTVTIEEGRSITAVLEARGYQIRVDHSHGE